LIIRFLLITIQSVLAENIIGPEGHKLIWVAGFILFLLFLLIVSAKSKKKGTRKKNYNIPFIKRNKIKITLKKDRIYYPDFLELTIINTANTDIDIDYPLLIFSNDWLSRKFRLKGTNSYNFYPLYLGKGEKHTLSIDLNRFYNHDKSLKRFPRTKIVIYEVNGQKLGSEKVMLRKTLFNF